MKYGGANSQVNFRYPGAVMFMLLILCSGNLQAQQKNLDYYINTALAASPLLKDYQNQLSSARIDSQRLKANFAPQVSGIASNTIAPVLGGFGYDAAITNIASFTDVVNVNQVIVGRNNLSTQYRGIGLLGDSLRNQRKLTEQDLKRTVTTQYITAYGDLQQMNFYAEVYKMLDKQGSILKQLTENNIYRQTDYLTFLVTMKQQELQLKQIQIQFRNDYAMLNYLCGIYDTAASSLAAPEIVLAKLPDASSSIFFLRYKTDSFTLTNDLSILKYSYHPKLNVFANAGFSSSFLYQAYKNFGFSAGMNLNVPIYDGHQRQLQEHKIALQEQTNENYRDFFSRQYDQQIAMLRQQLAATELLIGDINDQIKYAEGLIDVNGRLLETGDARISDFVIAINNYLSAKNLLTQNNISRMQIINQLNYWNR